VVWASSKQLTPEGPSATARLGRLPILYATEYRVNRVKPDIHHALKAIYARFQESLEIGNAVVQHTHNVGQRAADQLVLGPHRALLSLYRA
jgi:hypothetical protein